MRFCIICLLNYHAICKTYQFFQTPLQYSLSILPSKSGKKYRSNPLDEFPTKEFRVGCARSYVTHVHLGTPPAISMLEASDNSLSRKCQAKVSSDRCLMVWFVYVRGGCDLSENQKFTLNSCLKKYARIFKYSRHRLKRMPREENISLKRMVRLGNNIFT